MNNRVQHLLAALAIGFITYAVPASAAPSPTPTPKISEKQAAKVALQRFPGKVQGKIKLENEEGVWQYAVMVRSNGVLREVMVNARSGHIDNVESTTDAKEAAEKKAEEAARKGQH